MHSLLAILILLMATRKISSFFASTGQATAKKPRVASPARQASSSSITGATAEPDSGEGRAVVSSMSEFELACDEMEPEWKVELQSEFKKAYFLRLMAFLDKEKKAGKTVYPPLPDLFTAFSLCPFSKVKVVIIGQDPYHGPGQGHGLAFSVRKGVQIPPSLRNMIKEAASDTILRPKVSAQPGHGYLAKWAAQGVLMLNTCLTVRKGEANSHNKQGWEEFTDAVVARLRKKEKIVYLCWGRPAAAKCASINMKVNHVITTSHPSPLGATKTDKPFMGSRCFSRCNTALLEYGKESIDWNLN